MVTVCVPVEPEHTVEVALAVIVVVPVQVAIKVTSPVAALIVFPAARLVASKEYAISVAPKAVAV